MPASRRTAAKMELSNSERLLLAQAVYELGSNAWPQVSKLIVNHPLTSRLKSFFTAQSCNEIYVNLMNDAGIDCADPQNTTQRAPLHLKLAQIHYQVRVLELRELILAEESKFKTVLAEIDEIKAGLWDSKIKAGLGISSPPPEQAPIAPLSTESLPVEPGAQPIDSPLVIEEDHDLEEDMPLTPLSPPPSAPTTDNKGGSPTSQSIEIDAQDNEMQSPLDPESATSKESESINHTEEPTNQDFEEDEVSFQLAHLPSSSPAHSENVPTDKNLVPMYPDRESSPPVEAHEQASEPAETLVPDVETETPQLGAPDLIQEIEEERPAQEPAKTEVIEEPASRAGSEEPLSISARNVKEQEPQDSSMEHLEDIASPQQKVLEDSTAVGDVSPETPPFERNLESPKLLGSDLGVQTRRGKRKAEFEAELKREKKKVREDSEPVEEEEQVPIIRRRRSQAQTADHVATRRFQTIIGLVHSQISQHRNGNIFHNPIKPSEAPDYHDIVKRPMDLKSIKARIKDGVISNSLEYQRDVYLMFANSMMYNRPNSDIYNMAEEMMLESEQHISTFRQTEGWNNR